MSDDRRPIPGEWPMTGAAVLWGSAYPASRFVLAELPPFATTAWRGLLAFAALVVVLVVRGRLGEGIGRPGQWRRLTVLALLAGPAFVVGQNIGVERAGASVTSFVAGSYPIVAVLLAPLVLPERLAPRVVVAVVVALAGMLLLARPGGAHVDAAGVAAGIGASLAFGAYLVLARRWGASHHIQPMQIAVTNMTALVLVGAGLQLIAAPAALVPSLTVTGWFWLTWIAVPCGAGAHLLAMTAVRRLPAGRSSPFLLLAPISGALLSGILVPERLDLLQVAGGALIVAAIALATLPGWLPARSMAA
jgi:drug/metabolite transporter (DMT)-like permease